MRKITTVAINQRLLNMIQALFEDYKAKQDLLAMLFELHKEDTDDSLLYSNSFLIYEEKFKESKVAFDTCIQEMKNLIPEDLRENRFEVNFKDKCIEIWR